MATTTGNQRSYQMESTTNSQNNGGSISNSNSNNNGNGDEMSQRKEKIIIQNQMFINLQQQPQQQQQQISEVQQQQQQQQQQHVVKRAPKKLTQPPAIFSTTSAITMAAAAAAAGNDNRDATNGNNSNNNNNQDIANFIANSPTAATYVQAQLNNINGLNIQTTADPHHQHHQLTASVVAPTSVATTTLPIVTYNGNQYCVITHTGDITGSAGVGDKPELLQLTTDKEGKTNFILMQPATAVTATTATVGLQNSTGDLVNN